MKVREGPDTSRRPERGIAHGVDKFAARTARSRVRIAYLKQFGRYPNISNPRLFTEWVQWRKLHDRSPHHPLRMDKIAAKAFASDLLGPEWTIPTLWSGRRLPERPNVLGKVMLKARHGCGQNAAISEEVSEAEWRGLQALSREWCKIPYGGSIGEWAYTPVPRGLLIEPFVTDTGDLPIDYKIYVFGGVATHVQVHLDRGRQHRWVLHDRQFRPLSKSVERLTPPRTLAAMIDAAEALAANEDFMRVDFYEVGGRPLFGEFCLYPGSGHHRFALPELDRCLGNIWTRAVKARRFPSGT